MLADLIPLLGSCHSRDNTKYNWESNAIPKEKHQRCSNKWYHSEQPGEDHFEPLIRLTVLTFHFTPQKSVPELPDQTHHVLVL
jgi:hypothetical protein